MRFLFEDYVLDEARHELRRGGEIVPIEARVFELLTYLIRNRERVVSQEDLRMAVWEGRIVSISTISSSLNAVRTAIGDSGDDQRFIRTVPRKGFRFVAPVAEEPTGGTPTTNLEAAGSAAGPMLPAAQPAGALLRRVDVLSGHPTPPAIMRPRAIRTAVVFATGAVAGALAATLFFLLTPCRARRNLARRKNSMRRPCRSSMTTRGAPWPAMPPGPTTRRWRSEAGGNSRWPTARRP